MLRVLPARCVVLKVLSLRHSSTIQKSSSGGGGVPIVQAGEDAGKWEDFRAAGHKLVDLLADAKRTANSSSGNRCVAVGSPSVGFVFDAGDSSIVDATDEHHGSSSLVGGAVTQTEKLRGLLDQFGPTSELSFVPSPNDACCSPGSATTRLASALLEQSCGPTWTASPLSTELQCLAANKVASMLHLPSQFSWRSVRMESTEDIDQGGGVLHTSAAESFAVAVAAAKQRHAPAGKFTFDEPIEKKKFVCYCSNLTDTLFTKICKLLNVEVRLINVKYDETMLSYMMRPIDLARQAEIDISRGFTPLIVALNLGNRRCGCVDPITELLPVAKTRGIWIHVDARIGASSLAHTAYRDLPPMLDSVNSITVPAEVADAWSCGAVLTFFARIRHVVQSLHVPLNEWETHSRAVDVKDFALGESCTSAWASIMIMSSVVGRSGLQSAVARRDQCAHAFYTRLRALGMMEVPCAPFFGIVLFRVKIIDDLANRKILEAINGDGQGPSLDSCALQNKLFLRASFHHPACSGVHVVDALLQRVVAVSRQAIQSTSSRATIAPNPNNADDEW